MYLIPNFHDAQPVAVLLCDFIQSRHHGLARRIPFGPIVHEDRKLWLEYLLIEIGLIHLNDGLTHDIDCVLWMVCTKIMVYICIARFSIYTAFVPDSVVSLLFGE